MNANRNINGIVKSSFNIIRTVAGLSIPVRCFLVDNTFIGSCTYNDTCTTWINTTGWNPNNCPAIFLNAGINCRCPFNLPAGPLDETFSIEIQDLSQNLILSFMASGDFDVKLSMSDSVGFLGSTDF